MSYQTTVNEILEKFLPGRSMLATKIKILHEDAVTMTLQFSIDGDTHIIKAISEGKEWSIHEQR
jgi:hypothetical protein